MDRLVPGLFILCLLLAACSAPALSEPVMSPAPPSFRIIAYATDGVVETLIPYNRLTHINYSFLTPNADGTFNHIVNGWKLEKIVETSHAQGVQVLISVGGWGWDAEFEEMAADPESRGAFVQNLKAFVDEYRLDGADIDWEYPDPGESSQNFLALIRELRTAMPDKLITTAVVAYGDEYGMGVPAETFELFDFVNVMTYAGRDHGTLEQFNKGLEYWSGRGLPSEKIVLGVPFYSEPGGISFAKLTKNDPASARMDSFEYIGAQQNYNGIPTIQEKTRIAMEKSSGIMFWALDHDAQGEYSLVEAIYQVVHPSP